MQLFFCVKTPVKIGSTRYLPCVNYTLPGNIYYSVKELEAKGKAEVSETPFLFANGKKIILEKKRGKK